MNDKERLVELLENAHFVYLHKLGGGKMWEEIADYLLKNGVIVPPCKVGDCVWFIQSRGKIMETKVEKIVLKGKGIYIKLACNAMYETSCNSIGKTVFFTKEEAEKALAERGEQ